MEARYARSSSSAPVTSVTYAIFVLSIIWFKSKQKQYGSSVNEDEEGISRDDDIIGQRGASSLKKTPSYWESFIACLQNPCDKNLNPQGHIPLCLAENKLVQEALAIRLMQQGTGVNAFSDSAVYCYNGFLGLPAARAAVAYFVDKRFWRRTNGKKNNQNHSNNGGEEKVKDAATEGMLSLEEKGSLSPYTSSTGISSMSSSQDSSSIINPDHIAFGSGVGSLLNHLFYILAEKGDVVLIPAPYYASFEYDAKAIAGCEPRPVYMDNPILGPNPKDLENAAKIVEKEGKRVKVLLLTNPNDPLGVVYKRNVMEGAVEWARSRNIHTIVDEIYALSTHKPDSHPDRFESIIRVLDNNLGNDVHFLWGLSKDFGASGFRIGILYTQNERLLQSLANLNIFSGVSHPMQMIAAEILTDDDFVDAFLDDARSQLTWSYTICTQKLEEMVIPYVPAEAGLFVYVDFSSLLPEPTFEGEKQFASFVQDVARVVMTPGECQRDCKPGMFRLCYAWVSSEVLEIAMERLSYLVLQMRRHRWEEGSMPGNWKSEVIKCGTHLSMRRSFSVNISDLSHVNPNL